MARPPFPYGFEGHCLRCLLRQEVCVCAQIPRIETTVTIVVVQHIVERLRTSNTGRLAALALPNSEVLEYGGLPPLDEARIAQPDTWLLYPSPTGASGPPPRRLVVLDGTWHQSRKMYARLRSLRSMPCLAIAAADPNVVRLRQPNRPDGMSTIEAVAAALARLEPDGEAKARLLLGVHDAHVQAVVKLRGYPKPIDPEDGQEA